MTSLWRKFPSGNKLTVKNFYSKTQDGIIVNNEWWGATQVPLTLTLNKTSLAVDPQQLSLTLTTTTPFVGTIGKGSMILVGKQQSVRLGRLLTTGKSTLALTYKQLGLSIPFVSMIQKANLLVNTKSVNTSVGNRLLLSKSNVTTSLKNLSISSGVGITVGKSTLNTSTHVLSVHLGFNGTTVPQAIPTTPHIFNVSGGFVGDVGLYNLLVAGKTLRVINTKLIYPSEQIFSMTERSSNFVMKPRKTFYTLTDK